LEHIRYLSIQIGERVSSSDKEAEAAVYIKDQLEATGIGTVIEEFTFESFQIDSIILRIANSKYSVLQTYFNPYDSVFRFEDNFILTDSIQNIEEPSSIKESIVITKNANDYFNYAFAGAEHVFIVDSLTFKKILVMKERNCSASIYGGMKQHKSQNVIGEIRAMNETEQYIILGAHHDSYPTSPGADDNASGVGALIELGRYFKSIHDKLHVNLKLISFGSEEKGILGSRIYLDKHHSDMKDCILMVNMDFIGGPSLMMEILGGVSGIPETTGQNQFPEKIRIRPWESIHSEWKILEPDIIQIFAITNKPDWLVKTFRHSIQKLGIQIREAGS